MYCFTAKHFSFVIVQLISIFSCSIIATPVFTELSSPVLLVRLKRSPNRAMTYSAFNPVGGMAAFSSSDFLPHYVRYVRPLAPPSATSAFRDSQSFGNSPASTNESPGVALPPEDNRGVQVQSDGSSPDQTLTNGNGADSSNGLGGNVNTNGLDNGNGNGNGNEFDASAPGVRKAKKKPLDDDDDDYEDRKSGKSSFNAWFPIMLSMYPGGGSKSADGNGKEGLYGATIIANSVSNGRSGVAHAIAYGGGAIPSFASVEHRRTSKSNGNGSGNGNGNGNSV